MFCAGLTSEQPGGRPPGVEKKSTPRGGREPRMPMAMYTAPTSEARRHGWERVSMLRAYSRTAAASREALAGRVI